MISVIASVASGLPLGPEGPMIHIGGTIGASVESRNTILQKFVPWYQFRNQEDKRHFVLGGVAAGVSAAFNAPIGGLAFAWEEISTFWEDKQAWMILFGCMISAFITNLLLSITFDTGHSGNFTRGTILFFVPSVSSLGVWIFIPAIVIGLIGGGLGIIFTWIALFFARQRRKKFFQNKIVKLIEPCIIVLLFMSIGFVFPYAFSCTIPISQSSDTTNITDKNVTQVDGVDVSRWICPEGLHNMMANLSLQPGHEIIKTLISHDNAGAFPYEVLGAFLVYYFLFAAWCAGGVSLASGFVVPMITIGATYGRIIGKLMTIIAAESEFNTPGLYALLGSAAFFAGVSRLSVSLTIIMIELSGDVLMAFPLMVCIMVAKNFADLFIHPLYHAQLALKGVPYLDEAGTIAGIETLRVNDVMTGNVIAIHEVENIACIMNILETYDFSAFPVISKDLCYEGMIQRKEIKILLSQRDIFVKRPTDRPNKILTWYDMKIAANRKELKREEVIVLDEDLNKYIDFGPYSNTGVFSIPINFFLKDAYTLFRTMALTHLIVVNRRNQLVGVITRKDLLGENIMLKRQRERKQMKNKFLKAFATKKESTIDY